MSERKINLEEILINVFEPSSQYCSTPLQDLQLAITLNPDVGMIKDAMIEFGKRLLELAAENANLLNSKGEITGGISVDEYEDELSWRKIVVDYMVNKQSIVDTINKIE